MLTVKELNSLISGEVLTKNDESLENEVRVGLTCDLLSWVMARGAAECAWVTVQTHMNVIAVAALHDMACVIMPEGIRMAESETKKADDEGIAVITSELSAFEICGIMYKNGILPPTESK